MSYFTLVALSESAVFTGLLITVSYNTTCFDDDFIVTLRASKHTKTLVFFVQYISGLVACVGWLMCCSFFCHDVKTQLEI